MQIARQLLLTTILFPFLALAESASDPSPGVWTLPPGSVCEMTFQITTDHRIIRTTGTLSYTTTAVFVSEGRGWVLNEQLEEDNGGVSCRGQNASQVTQHLEKGAYIELLGDTLFYYLSRSDGRHLEFKRSSAQPVAPASGPALLRSAGRG